MRTGKGGGERDESKDCCGELHGAGVGEVDD